MNALNASEVTTGSTSATRLVLTDVTMNEPVTFTLEVTSGTIQFGVGAIDASAYANASGAKRLITCKNGDLYFKGAGASDKFVVSV